MLICLLSLLVSADEISEINAIDNDPTIVIGMKSIGIVIPTAIPKSDKACELVYPTAINLAGIIKAISGWTILDNTLIPVIGVEDFKTSL